MILGSTKTQLFFPLFFEYFLWSCTQKEYLKSALMFHQYEQPKPLWTLRKGERQIESGDKCCSMKKIFGDKLKTTFWQS